MGLLIDVIWLKRARYACNMWSVLLVGIPIKAAQQPWKKVLLSFISGEEMETLSLDIFSRWIRIGTQSYSNSSVELHSTDKWEIFEFL
jgi:hypothetical protein